MGPFINMPFFPRIGRRVLVGFAEAALILSSVRGFPAILLPADGTLLLLRVDIIRIDIIRLYGCFTVKHVPAS